MRLLREFLSETSNNSQSKVNKIIERQVELIGAEYDSLAIKLKQFASVVKTGKKFLSNSVSEVAAAQATDLTKKNITLGLQQTSDRNPLTERMLKFLIEIGLLFPLHAVSHGPNRKYDRYIPHLAFLYQEGAFREGRKSTFKSISNVMQSTPSKHPLRRDFKSLLSEHEIANLKLDLPPCQACDTARFNDSQQFCHNCGEKLVIASLFEECMKLPLNEVPDISQALIRRVHKDTKFRTVGDVIASQNASMELQKAKYIGPIRANELISKVSLAVEEFLS